MPRNLAGITKLRYWLAWACYLSSTSWWYYFYILFNIVFYVLISSYSFIAFANGIKQTVAPVMQWKSTQWIQDILQLQQQTAFILPMYFFCPNMKLTINALDWLPGGNCQWCFPLIRLRLTKFQYSLPWMIPRHHLDQ